MKKKIEFKKAFFSTILWGLTISALSIHYLDVKIDLNLLDFPDIRQKYFQFIAGQSVLSGADMACLLIVLLLFFPLWIVGAILIYRIPLRLPEFRARKEKKMKANILNMVQENRALKMPAKLKLQAYAHSTYYPPDQSATGSSGTQNQADSIETAIEEIADLANKYQVMVCRNVTLGDYEVPVVCASDTKALLIYFLKEGGVNWSVDTKGEITDNWFCSSHMVDSPVAILQKAALALHEMEPDSEILSAVIMLNGEMEDAENVSHFLAEYMVYMGRMLNGKPELLPDMAEILYREFSPDAPEDLLMANNVYAYEEGLSDEPEYEGDEEYSDDKEHDDGEEYDGVEEYEDDKEHDDGTASEEYEDGEDTENYDSAETYENDSEYTGDETYDYSEENQTVEESINQPESPAELSEGERFFQAAKGTYDEDVKEDIEPEELSEDERFFQAAKGTYDEDVKEDIEPEELSEDERFFQAAQSVQNKPIQQPETSHNMQAYTPVETIHAVPPMLKQQTPQQAVTREPMTNENNVSSRLEQPATARQTAIPRPMYVRRPAPIQAPTEPLERSTPTAPTDNGEDE